MNWQPYNTGKTLGLTGPQGGIIQRDEEYDSVARITLEAECLRAPYAITCSIYGVMFPHTRFVADDETALYAVETMQQALVALADMLPAEDAADYDAQFDAVVAATADFAQRFP